MPILSLLNLSISLPIACLALSNLDGLTSCASILLLTSNAIITSIPLRVTFAAPCGERKLASAKAADAKAVTIKINFSAKRGAE